MSDTTIPPEGDELKPEIVHFPLPQDNLIQTFTLEKANIRGRVLRLGKALDDILDPLKYPTPVAKLTAETAVLAVLLSSMLKFEGVFILQAQGDGAVTRLVADVTTAGIIRACAGYDHEKVKNLPENPTLKDMLGTGYMAFTVDQGENMDRYQGIVALEGDDLQQCVHHYFNQSEQIKTAIKIGLHHDGQGWRAGAIMLQHMPLSANIPQDVKPTEDGMEEHWNRVQILLETCREDELLDPRLHENVLLYRLFHEEGVRIFTPLAIQKGCRCNEDKLRAVIKMLPVEDQTDIVIDGKITLTCEFCNTEYSFSPDTLERL